MEPEQLAGVESLRGTGEATRSIAVDGLRLFALSAKSTFLGCTVSFVATLGASRDIEDYNGDGLPDGRLMDPCHQAQWDPFHHGVAVTPHMAPVPLATLTLGWDDDELVGFGFDGPVGSQRRK